MIKREDGFTLVELMITMTIFVLIIAAASGVFTELLTQFKQQSKIAEFSVEGIIGLEILRKDVEHAGYGLPWNIPRDGVVDVNNDGGEDFWEDLPNYQEAIAGGQLSKCDDATRDIDMDGYDGEAPRGICSVNNTGVNASDYLVIKAINVAKNGTDQKWTNLTADNAKTTWDPDCENVNKLADCSTKDDVRVIVIAPGDEKRMDLPPRSLVLSGGSYLTSYNNTIGFVPLTPTDTFVVYGVDPLTNLRMPFNRADYYIRATGASSRCAPNTGVLVKAVISHDDGDFDLPPEDDLLDEMPLLDCVADMQVVYGLDVDEDGDFEPGATGSTDTYSDSIETLTAERVRRQVKEIRIYVLTHEAGKDITFAYSNTSIGVPASPDPAAGVGSTFNLQTRIGSDYQYYRWKVHAMIIHPFDLIQERKSF